MNFPTPAECGANCAECPYGKDGKHGLLVYPDVPDNAQALLIGESPGSREVEEGRPFVGPTGQKLAEAMLQAGLDYERLVKVNVIACKPTEPKDEDDMDKAAAACLPFFRYSVGRVSSLPKFAMGSYAKAAIGARGAVQNIRGFLWPSLESPNAIVSWHPTYAAFHNPYEWGNFLLDAQRFGRLVRGNLRQLYKEIYPLADAYSLDKVIYQAKLNNVVYLDIESRPVNRDEPWTAKDPTRALVHQIGIGSNGYACSVFWRDATPDMLHKLRQLCANPRVTKVMHNGWWFDIPVLERCGFTFNNVRDTRDMRRANMSNSKLSLRYLGSISCDIHNWKDEGTEDVDHVDEKNKGGAFTDDKELAGTYNCLDCIVTEHADTTNLADHQAEAARGANVVQLYDVHTELSQLCAEMYDTGIYVHREMRDFMWWFLEQSVAEKRRKVAEAVSLFFGTATSPDEAQDDDTSGPWRVTAHGLRSLLYERHRRPGWPSFGLPDPIDKRMWTDPDLRRTISVSEDALRIGIVSDSLPQEAVPIIMLWLDYQGEVKRLGTIKSALLDQAIGVDGRLRPGWNSCGTETMRFACSEPNVMNVEQLLRHMFAPGPGNVIVHADKAQLELRVMALVAADETLKQAIRTGDVYSFDAASWFAHQIPEGSNVKKQFPKLRQACKIIHLAKQYAAQDKTVWAQALEQDMTFKFSAVQVLSRAFNKTYSRTLSYWQEEFKRVAALHYSEGRILFGRIYYPQMPELSEAVNKPVQRTASEMMNVEVLGLWKRLKREVPKARIIIQLHDAVDVECPEQYEEQVKQILMEEMNRDWTFCNQTFNFPIEIKVARARDGINGTWAEV